MLSIKKNILNNCVNLLSFDVKIRSSTKTVDKNLTKLKGIKNETR
jgi:hypothetical protein